MRRHFRLVIFSPYPFGEAPSQRFRFEQYLNLMKDKGFKVTLFSFYNQLDWQKLYSSSHFKQILRLFLAFVRAFSRVPSAITADFVLIHREIMPIGPPIVEWILAKVFRKKIIYDYDDAIWMTDKTNESFILKSLRWRSKVADICKWSYKVSCGNAYLAEYAKQFNSNVVINPTTIDTQGLHNPSLFDKSRLRENIKISGVIIGWTGSHSTLKYLEEFEPILMELEDQHPEVSLLVIADTPPQLKLKRVLFYKWSKETEIRDLILADIGIMPLPDDNWAKGKCGFKALQYMALGIPTVVSPIGVNSTIIQHGKNGYCCSKADEWKVIIASLVKDHELRKKIGGAGQQTVLKHYSVASNSASFLSLFQ